MIVLSVFFSVCSSVRSGEDPWALIEGSGDFIRDVSAIMYICNAVGMLKRKKKKKEKENPAERSHS